MKVTEQSRSNLKKCCLGRLFNKLKEEKVIKEQQFIAFYFPKTQKQKDENWKLLDSTTLFSGFIVLLFYFVVFFFK